MIRLAALTGDEEIRDPVHGAIDDFQYCYERIAAAVAQLQALLT